MATRDTEEKQETATEEEEETTTEEEEGTETQPDRWRFRIGSPQGK